MAVHVQSNVASPLRTARAWPTDPLSPKRRGDRVAAEVVAVTPPERGGERWRVVAMVGDIKGGHVLPSRESHAVLRAGIYLARAF